MSGRPGDGALWAAALVVAAATLACASAQPPPGGPERHDPPALVRVTPDTNAVNITPRAVVFLFDEVIDDRGRSGASLPDLVLISPRDGAPDVDWRRRAVAVRPRRGWRANTAYTVTLLPGVSDLRGNVRKEPATLVFSTGPSIPETRIGGIVFDWAAGRPAPKALIEAFAPPDTSTVFVTQADAGGRFELAHLLPGRYVVRGTIDLNNNKARDAHEPFDTAVVVLADSATTELLAFVHDSIPPRIAEVSVRDSTTLRLTFDRPLAIDWHIDPALFTLRRRDSTEVPIVAAFSQAEYERHEAARRRRRVDSAHVADTTRPAVPLPVVAGAPPSRADSATESPRLPSRPVPIRDIMIRTAVPLVAQATYRIAVRDVRGLLGAARTTERTFSTPKAAPRDTTVRPPPPTGRPPTRSAVPGPLPAGRIP